MKPTYARIREVLHYDPETGECHWLVDIAKNHKAGSRVGHRQKDGYWVVGLDRGGPYKLAQIIWLYMTGAWPTHIVDHHDGDNGNNKWSNLREATFRQSAQNRSKNSLNTSGHKNVHYIKSYKGWGVSFRMGEDRKQKLVFCSRDLEMAVLVASEWRDKLHGKFARMT